MRRAPPLEWGMTEQEAVSSSKPVAAPASERPLAAADQFDGNSTAMFQAKMKRAPVWFCSFLAGNSREKLRLRDELAQPPDEQ